MDSTIRDIIKNTYHRHIPPDVKIVERNGYIFLAHPRMRFDPITSGVLTKVAMGTMIAGTTIGMMGKLREGERAEDISEQRAAADIASAEAVRRMSVEEARIKKEKGRRFLEEQKAAAAAGGIRLNVGAPLVIEAETRADIAKDVGFVLERGREEERFYKSRAAIEKARGKAKRKRSRWEAISQGLTGFGSLAFMGTEAGWWGK